MPKVYVAQVFSSKDSQIKMKVMLFSQFELAYAYCKEQEAKLGDDLISTDVSGMEILSHIPKDEDIPPSKTGFKNIRLPRII